ncbi:MAG: rhomboid family intramembrane serine protease [Anaerolineae bacterium]
MNESLTPQPRTVSLSLPLHKPVVTWILLAAIVVMFALETLAGGSTNTQVLVRFGAKVNPLIAAGEYWRLFTAMFLHIGIVHLAFNGYALVVIGTEAERLLGAGRFLVIYLLSGLFGSLASYAFSTSLSAGASGAIFGLIGALAAFFALHRRRLGAWGRSRLANIAFLLVVNLFLGFTQPGIDNMGHLGGLLSGLALGWVLAPRYQVDVQHLQLVDSSDRRWIGAVLVVAILLLVGGTVTVTEVQRNSPQAHRLRAQQALEREDWAEAAAALEQALQQDPSSADASLYFNLGLARNYLEQPRLAAAAYEKALALEPEDSSSHWNLGITYIELGQYREALPHFEAYLDLNPGAVDEVQPYLDELRGLTR